MKEFRKEILRETVSMLEEKIGGNFSRKVRTKLTVLGELLFIPLCNMLAVFDVLDSAAVLYKEATIYASREIQGKQKKSKIAKFDFEVSKYHEVTGQHLNVKIYSPIFLEVFKE